MESKNEPKIKFSIAKTKTKQNKYKCYVCKKPILGMVVLRKKDNITFHTRCVDIEWDSLDL